MIKRLINAGALTLSAGCVALIIMQPTAAAEGARNGLTICGQIIVPALFPLTVIAGFIVSSGVAELCSRPLGALLGRLLRLPDSACTALTLSFVSGYPVGGTLVKRLYQSGSIDAATAERMLCYTVNAGPAMIILVVGQGLFGSRAAGWLLYGVHIAAALIIGAATAWGKPRSQRCRSRVVRISMAEAFISSVYDGCTAMLNICGTVVLFSTGTAIISAIFGEGAALYTAPLEVTQGCITLAAHGLPAVSALLGFGGLSVILQVLTVATPLVSLGRLLLSRAAHAALSYLLCRLLLPLIGDSIATFSNGTAGAAVACSHTVYASCAMLIFGAVTLFYCSGKQKVFTSAPKV